MSLHTSIRKGQVMPAAQRTITIDRPVEQAFSVVAGILESS
jgi:hypothetical protein